MSAPTPVVQPGQVLAGKYRVERVLGAGAMGVVVAAMHLELDERVALKFMSESVAKHPDAIARFSREARAAAKIKSEHVARVADVGRLESGAPYLVMEYLVGTDVEKLLLGRRPVPVTTAVDYVLQACEAIAEAHAIGIIHRDLKPANLFIARRADGSECVKVLDFGISRVMPGTSQSGRDAAMTHTSAVMGTPLYMSPEQMDSPRNAAPASDIWSLGAILYELLIGRPPFDAQSLPQLAMMVVHHDPPPMQARRAEVPPALEAAVRRCLAKDPTRRFASVAELAAALAPFSPVQGAVSAGRARKVLFAAAPTAAFESPFAVSSTHDEPVPPTVAATSAPVLAATPSSMAASTGVGASHGLASSFDTRASAPTSAPFAAPAVAKASIAAWIAVAVTLLVAATGVGVLVLRGGPGAVATSPAASGVAEAPSPKAAAPDASPASPPSAPAPSAVASAAPSSAAVAGESSASPDDAPASTSASPGPGSRGAPPPGHVARPHGATRPSPPPASPPPASPPPSRGLFNDRN